MRDWIKFLITFIIAFIIFSILFYTCKGDEIPDYCLPNKVVMVDKYPIVIFDYHDNKVTEMRLSGYTYTGNKTAIMENFISGWTAAVSPKCIYLLGEKVYVRGYGIRYINDLTASWVDDKFDHCTLDLAVPNREAALALDNKIVTVVRLSTWETELLKH